MGNTCCINQPDNLQLKIQTTEEIGQGIFGANPDKRTGGPSQKIGVRLYQLVKQSKNNEWLSQMIFKFGDFQKKFKEPLRIQQAPMPINKLPDQYYITSLKSIYVGEWLFHKKLEDNVPGGIGRLFQLGCISEGVFKTYLQDQLKSQENQQDQNKIDNSKNKSQYYDDIQFVIKLNGTGRIYCRQENTLNEVLLQGVFQKGLLHGKGMIKSTSVEQQSNYRSFFGKQVKRIRNKKKKNSARTQLMSSTPATLSGALNFSSSPLASSTPNTPNTQPRVGLSSSIPLGSSAQILNQTQIKFDPNSSKMNQSQKSPKFDPNSSKINQSQKGPKFLKKTQYQYNGNFLNGKKHGKGSQKVKYLFKSNKGQFQEQQKKETEKRNLQSQSFQYDGSFIRDLKDGKGTLVLLGGLKNQNKIKKDIQKMQKKVKNQGESLQLETFKKLKIREVQQEYIQKRLSTLQKTYKASEIKLKKQGAYIFDTQFMVQRSLRTIFNQTYIGEFKQGKMQGQGTYLWPNGKIYRGIWQNNSFHGYGQFYWPDGTYYQGEYKNDQRDGKGLIIWNLFKRYRGSWAYGMRHGYGQSIQINKDKTQLTIIASLWNRDKVQKQLKRQIIDMPDLNELQNINIDEYYEQLAKKQQEEQKIKEESGQTADSPS